MPAYDEEMLKKKKGCLRRQISALDSSSHLQGLELRHLY
jgi:hypothetical protein